MKTAELTQKDRVQWLIDSGIDWYLVDYDDGTTECMHESMLSNILQCGHDPSEYSITHMERCWGGEDLSDG